MQYKLKALREYKGLTSSDMAKVAGIGKDSYILKENGKNQFKLNEMFQIANKLNMKVDDIFSPTE